MIGAVVVKNNAGSRSYNAFVDGEFAGSIIYEQAGDRRVAFTHTFVEPRFRGHGVGNTLVRGALDDVRSNGLTLTNFGDFVAHYRRASRVRRPAGRNASGSCPVIVMHGRPQSSPKRLRPVREHPRDRVDGTLHRDSCRSSELAHSPHGEAEPVGVVMAGTPGDRDKAEAGTRDRSARSVDDQQWIEGLSGTGAPHERTCEQLHEILFRAARREARQRGIYLRVAGPDLDDLACQAASDALLLIIRKVRDFRGESRFTTWATRFVVFQVIAKLRQHVRPHRSSTSLPPPELWEELPAAHPSPDLEAEARDLARVVLHAVDSQLTSRQRTVLLGLVRGATPAALAGELELNANAVHQTMFRARRRLRHHLTAQGYLGPSDSTSGPTVPLAENRKRAS